MNKSATEFKLGKEYIFTKEFWLKDKAHSKFNKKTCFPWVDAADGEKVSRIFDSENGMTENGTWVKPDWCIEI